MSRTVKEILENKEKMVVHLGLCYDFSKFKINCEESFIFPLWDQPPLPSGVFLLKDGRFYTFKEELATCDKCLESNFNEVNNE